MNKSRLALPVTALTLSILFLSGCKTGGAVSDEAATVTTGAVGNSAPSIWGDPESTTMVGAMYLFQPEASDSDGDVLEFSIANQPEWAEFDTVSGSLQGVPVEADAGINENIVISVTDKTSVVSLASFTIEVRQDYAPPPDVEDDTSSQAPVISGSPNTSAVVGTHYSFQPEASDEEGDELSFSIVNKPSWASFDTVTGRLQGQPASGDVGTSDLIEVSVTDGTSIAALGMFRIDVDQSGAASFTVSWTAPSQNEDGTALTDLAGYRVYYGTTSGEYSEEVVLDSPGLTSYLIENLAEGRYFLVMTSVNSSEMESKYTPEISFDLGS